ncbi:MAG: glycosyltransferase [candidate division Zixibacteria bacterium]|nr:glycosyltransferase [candidate division Zixibacteria bacterium]
MRICFLILNPFDFDSRARFICQDILSSGWKLDIIATDGGELNSFGEAPIHRFPQPVKPFRQRRFIDFNIRAASLAGKLKADIYHAVDLDTLWAAVKASKACKAKIIYESRELYTEQYSLYKRPAAKAFWRNLEKRLIKKADAVVAVNESIANELVNRYSINRPKIVMNAAKIDETAQPINLRQKYNLASKYILIFQGILRSGQGLTRSLEAIAGLPDVSLVIVGDGPNRPSLEKQADELGLKERIRFVGKVSPDQLKNYTAGADAGLMLIKPQALNSYLALPQKLFQYIAAGVPPIISDLPEMRKIVRQDNLGLVIKNGSVESDINTIDGFLQNNLEAAAKTCHTEGKKYNWENEGLKMLEVYRNLIDD